MSQTRPRRGLAGLRRAALAVASLPLGAMVVVNTGAAPVIATDDDDASARQTGAIGTVMFVGSLRSNPAKIVVGVQLAAPGAGEHDGAVACGRYFVAPPQSSVFVPLAAVSVVSARVPFGVASGLPIGELSGGDDLGTLAETALAASFECSVLLPSPATGGTVSSRAPTSAIAGLQSAPHDALHALARASSSRTLHARARAVRGVSFRVGDTVRLRGTRAVVCFVGAVHFAPLCWLGLELATATGRNDGSVRGVSYFLTKPGHGLFVRPADVMPDAMFRRAVATADAYETLVRELGAARVPGLEELTPECMTVAKAAQLTAAAQKLAVVWRSRRARTDVACAHVRTFWARQAFEPTSEFELAIARGDLPLDEASTAALCALLGQFVRSERAALEHAPAIPATATAASEEPEPVTLGLA